MPLHNPPSGSSAIKRVSNPLQSTLTITPLLATEAAATNTARTYISFFNSGNTRVYFSDGTDVTNTDYIFFLEPNGFYETGVICPTHSFQCYIEEGAGTIQIAEYSE